MVKNIVNDRVMKDVGEVVQILYNLDIFLSNCFTGNPKNPGDKKIKALRKPVREALSSLDSKKWIHLLQERK